MSRSRFHPALVLRSVDVGEADRFCILLTPSLGRVAARITGARRIMSRMIGVLPGQVLLLRMTERSSGFSVTGTAPLEQAPQLAAGMQAFLHWQSGAELLLALLHDHEPSRELFDDAVRFVAVCGGEESPVPAYTLRVFSVLGLLPMILEDARFTGLSDAERIVVQRCGTETWTETMCDVWTPGLLTFVSALVREHVDRPMKVGMGKT